MLRENGKLWKCTTHKQKIEYRNRFESISAMTVDQNNSWSC